MSESKSDSLSNYEPAMSEKVLGPLGLLPGFETSASTKEKLEKHTVRLSRGYGGMPMALSTPVHATRLLAGDDHGQGSSKGIDA